LQANCLGLARLQHRLDLLKKMELENSKV
jgi:hypothetical protein